MAKKAFNYQTSQPDGPITLPIPKLDDDQWIGLGMSVMQFIRTNLGNRASLDEFLDYGNAMYEMRTAPRNSPWEGAANIVVPIVAAEVDEMTSRLTGAAIQPRPYTVRGNDPRSSQYSHIVEQFINGEFEKNEWYDPHETCIHLAARDGTSIMEVLWDLKKESRELLIDSPQMDETGQPQMDESGQPIMAKQKQTVEMVTYDAPRLNAVELRDFMLIPNYAPDIEKADAVVRKLYMSEQDMWAMVQAGIFKAEMVEKILSHTNTGQDEHSWDPQGTSTYTISNRISVSDVAIAPPEGIKATRGPVEIWRYHTRQFDLNNDGVCEENIIWVHDRSQLIAGVAPFEYMHGRPFFELSPMPRPNRFYGFSVPERVRGMQEEANAQHNARLDWMDYSLQPTIYKTTGARIRDEDMGIGPGKIWEVQKPDDIGFITLQDVPQSSTAEEGMLVQYASKATGAPQASAIPTGGGAQGGRVTARAAQNFAAIQGMQTNKMLLRVRRWMQRILRYAFRLYLRYGKGQLETVAQTQDGVERLTIPREILALDYTLGVAGLGGPLDKESRRNDAMLMFQMLSQNPLVGGNLARVWQLSRMVLETFDIPDPTLFIGTMEEANQQGQQQAQAAQQQANQQMMMQILSHTKVKPNGQSRPGLPGGAA